MYERGILKWAAGAPALLPEQDDIDETGLYSLLTAHRLEQRFLRRLEEMQAQAAKTGSKRLPCWCSRGLLFQLQRDRTIARTQQQKHFKALREITIRLAEAGHDLIVIKGPTVVAATGDERYLRYSSDLDLLSDNREALWATLTSLGYEGREAFGHEYGTFLGRGAMIELHNFFPVVSYPSDLKNADLKPAHHPGAWIQGLPNRVYTQIDYDLLAANSTSGRIPETRSVRMPDITMSVVVSCAHEFRNYLEMPFQPSVVKLGTLADIYELARSEEFDSERFQAIVEKAGAHDSVSFVASLIEKLYGSQPLPLDAPAFGVNAFPQSLSWPGCWAALSDLEEILFRWDTQATVDKLGANDILALAAHPPVYSIIMSGQRRDEDLVPLERVILRTSAAPDIRLTARAGSDDLHLTLTTFSSVPEGYSYEVHLWTRCGAVTGFFEAGFRNLPSEGPDKWTQRGITWPGTAEHTENRQWLEVRIPWKKLPLPFLERRRAPFLLRIMQHNELDPTSYGETAEPLAILPLQILWQ